MAMTLHYHPLASHCWKVLIALHELDEPFERVVVDLSDAAQAAAFTKLSPFRKMPALETAPGKALSETSVVIEWLSLRRPEAGLLPSDPQGALRVRWLDRAFDLYVMQPMQKIVLDKLRPEGARDPYGVAEARGHLRRAYEILETEIAGPWAAGPAFTLADCAAAPSLWYADQVEPIDGAHSRLADYLARLKERPSFARVLGEAEPWLKGWRTMFLG